MSETPTDKIVARLRKIYSGWGRDTTIEDMRRDWETLFAGEAVDVETCELRAGGVPARWIAAPGSAADKLFLFFHGGGFQLGSVATHAALIARISEASGARGLGIDYRLAPEHRFPAQLEDAYAAYRWVLDQGYAPRRIALVGDSAGGGLCLSLMLRLRERGLPLPAAAVLMSPWTDMTASGESFESRKEADPIHQRAMIEALAKTYLGKGGDPKDPLASPLFADLAGLPPLLIQVGDREVVLDDARQLAERASAAGVANELQVWDGMIHVFQLFAADIPEAREAIADIGGFLRARLETRE